LNLKTWLLAIRPKTLPAASGPVLVGSAVALGNGFFSFWPAVAALSAALLLQIGSNLANDVFDFKKGTDITERTGPLRVTQAGLLTPRQVFVGMGLTFFVAFLIGLYLIKIGGWPILLIGSLSIVSAILYTGGPYPIGYNGLGEVFVFIFFGPVAVCGTYYVQALSLNPHVWLASIPVGFLTMAILVVNNLRDIKTDAKTGKKTLAVRLGKRATQREYLLFLSLAFIIPVLTVLFGFYSPWLLLPFLATPLVISLVREIYTKEGAALNKTLAKTAQLELVYSLLYSAGYLLNNLLA